MQCYMYQISDLPYSRTFNQRVNLLNEFQIRFKSKYLLKG